MVTSFHHMPPSSRIWIFQSSRLLLPGESTELKNQTDLFLENWTAHKMDLQAASELAHHLFLVIAVDETVANASGCSIDKLYQFIKGVQDDLKIDLLDRLKVAFLNEEKSISIVSLKEMEQLLNSGKVDGDLTVFDTTVTTVEEYSVKFKVPLRHTWLNRYQIV